MARKRERFDRTDVPRESPRRNFVGAIVSVAALLVAAAVVAFFWWRMNLERGLEVTELEDALAYPSSASVVDGMGYAVSPDDIETTLLLEVDDIDAQTPNLVRARVLAVNHTSGTASVAGVPVTVKIDFDDPAALGDVCVRSGAAACAELLSEAAGVPFDHVIVSEGDVLPGIGALSGSGIIDLPTQASELVSSLRTDMSDEEVLALADDVAATGAAAADAPEVAPVPETVTDETGATTETGSWLVDGTQLALTLGLLVTAA